MPTRELVRCHRMVDAAGGTRQLVPVTARFKIPCLLHDKASPHQEEENREAHGQTKKMLRGPRNPCDGKQYAHAYSPSNLFAFLDQSKGGARSHQFMQVDVNVVAQKATTHVVPSTSSSFI
jgi:hypothetical protein